MSTEKKSPKQRYNDYAIEHIRAAINDPKKEPGVIQLQRNLSYADVVIPIVIFKLRHPEEYTKWQAKRALLDLQGG